MLIHEVEDMCLAIGYLMPRHAFRGRHWQASDGCYDLQLQSITNGLFF